jgi:unsaturated chondroitin disaccharide hydrolase
MIKKNKLWQLGFVAVICGALSGLSSQLPLVDAENGKNELSDVVSKTGAEKLPVTCTSKTDLIRQDVRFASQQLTNMMKNAKDPAAIPKTTSKDGSLKTVDIYDWCSGFYAGSLWRMYELTKNEKWKKEAIRWTEKLEPVKTMTANHDIGFMMFSSYGNAYRLTGDPNYKDVLLRAAKSLVTRYYPGAGVIKSWNYQKAWDGKTEWFFPVIIDNMMNLELLFFASKESGDPMFRNIAIKHAEMTMKNHLRANFSSYHVVDYDSVSGVVKHKGTNQGLSDESTWSRGQAWGIYGFTMVYRETKDIKFLRVAQKMADFYLDHPNLPADKIPYWDFNVSDSAYKPQWDYHPEQYPVIPRDASAAAITCSALMELSQFSGNKSSKYLQAASEILYSLSGPSYCAKPGQNNNFLLMHCVGDFPYGLEIDVPLNYADYYFLEALQRYQNINN